MLLSWMASNYQLLLGIFGWPVAAGIFLLTRKIIFRQWEQPFVIFEGPFPKDSSFGRTFFLSVKNISLTGIKRIISPRRTLSECHLNAKFTLNGCLVKEYSWWTDPELNPNGITLLPNSRRHSFDFVTKRLGDEECSIGTVAIGPDERLPKDSNIFADITLFDGNNSIVSSKWRINNHGSQYSDLQITRIDEECIPHYSTRYKSMLWFARIVPGIISFVMIWDIFTRGWFTALDFGGWLCSSSGAFVLAIESLWILNPLKDYEDKKSSGSSREAIEAVRLGIFLLMIGFVLISASKIVARLL